MSDQLATLVAQLKERRALSFQDRIKSLDIRDEIWRKYIELNKGSSVDAIAAQRTGLCPDMCCERERLTREYQRLCKSYELDPDTRALNHALMVTEYSRASADQAMPSPYDLRSGPVLLQTMNYLITNIMDKFDQEREQGDWYNFLWDRLRAIRKEITQQHLRDEDAIEILEQCARFHIFCSAFLSEYSRDLFDPRLNDKVLIDCLNQLRDCYTTHKQQNNAQSLKNIAEFSSYMLLINLKDDNETLLRVRHLIQDITNSSEVNVATNLHRSLLLNNTTKFFFLLENQATLLQCCLVNRYFNIIRSKRLSSLIASSRANDELRLSDLTEILGMDHDDETKDYLEQFGYSVTTTDPPCFMVPATQKEPEQQPIVKLSQKLIKSKYQGNLKDIITGYIDTPVVIPDTDIEDSFDLQGAFVGKLPFDLDKIVSTVVQRRPPPPVEQPQPQQQTTLPPRTQAQLPWRRPPSESALKSMASTTTANTFSMRTRPISTTNLFATATTTTPTLPTNFQVQVQGINPSSNVRSIFGAAPIFSSLPKTTFPVQITLPPAVRELLPPPSQPIQPPASISVFAPKTPDPIMPPPPPQPRFQPQPPPVARRLSTNSMDVFVDELYEEMLDPLIQETTSSIFDELISEWNLLTTQTVQLFNEFLNDEIISIAEDHNSHLEFHQKMLNDTLLEANEPREERLILNEIQNQYHFLSNEQLFEFLTGIQLLMEHDLTIEETTHILKSRRYLKRNRLKKISFLSNHFFDEYLNDELHSIVVESNSEFQLRQTLLDNALKKQAHLKREHYLRLKYFSLWISHFRQRKKRRQQQLSLNNNNKRTSHFLPLRSYKKLKESNQQYHTIKDSFDQLTTDLHQIQLFIDKLNS